jgi:hypothetical protein
MAPLIYPEETAVMELQILHFHWSGKVAQAGMMVRPESSLSFIKPVSRGPDQDPVRVEIMAEEAEPVMRIFTLIVVQDQH